MRILIVHNHYGNYAFGGEGMVMQAEAELMRSHGHEVFVYERTNSEIAQRSVCGKIKAFWDMTWSPEGYKAISDVIDRFKPDIMHVHNYKFLLSPAVFKAAKEKGVATVHTLHNYRLCCPSGQFMCNQKVCEDCLNDQRYYRILWRKCRDRKSFIKNFFELYLFYGNIKRKGYQKWIDAYICLSEFAKAKLIKCDFPSNKLYIKPHFMPDPMHGRHISQSGFGAIFVGRLSTEKGIGTLLEAWKGINYPLTIVGDGPLRATLEKAAPDNVKFVGFQDRQDVLKLIQESAFMVFPSELYETFGLSILESMAVGKTVIASDLGPRGEIVDDGITGLLFEAGNVLDLKSKIKHAISNQSFIKSMGKHARDKYLQQYTPELNYKILMHIYDTVQIKE